MTAMWDKFVNLLNQTLLIYQALLQLSRKKREILVEAKPQELEQLTKQEEMLIIEAGKLDKLRQTLTGELAAALGLPPGQTVLSVLIERADTETAAKLRTVSETFTEINDELLKLNELNERLIQQSLEFINFNINVLSQNKAEPTYAAKGQSELNGAGRSILDTKV